MMSRNPKCRSCDLWKRRKTVCVWGTGPTPCDLMIIAEAPGAKEDTEGEPLVGESGSMFRQVLSLIGTHLGETVDFRPSAPPGNLRVYLTNIVKCRPPQNRDPKKAEIAACRPYWREELAACRPRMILCLGRFALYEVVMGSPGPKPEVAIREGRHQTFWHLTDEGELIPVRLVHHPAAVLKSREPRLQTYWQEDMLKILAEVVRLKEDE